MARIVKHIACTFCGSDDNRAVYEDGHSFCFTPGCPKKRLSGDKMTEEEELEAEFAAISGSGKKAGKGGGWVDYAKLVDTVTDEYVSAADPKRKISKEVYEFYGVKVAYDSDGTVSEKYYPYNYLEKKPKGYKVRVMPKDFKSKGCIGTVQGLFGYNLFSGGLKLIITEGEEDTLAVAQSLYNKYKKFYPVMSLRSATGTGDLVDIREDLRKNYKEIILWMDQDTAGQIAMKEAAKIIGYDKVKVVKSSEKDACDLWLKDPAAVQAAVWNAVEYTPAGILTKESLWEKYQHYKTIESVPYPEFMTGINDKLKGMRFGEITLWTSGTGSGKSTILREIAFHLLKTTEDKIGIISLEESPAETVGKLLGMANNKNTTEYPLTEQEEIDGFEEVFGDDRIMVLDHHGSVADGSVVEHLEFMALKGVKYLFLDHITILVSEGAEGLTGNEATDKIMNDLLRLVKKHDVWLGLISHLRKTDNKGKSFEEGKLPSLDDIRGSGSIKQVSMDVISFARDVGATDEEIRNTIKTRVLKCRYTGLTGPSGSLLYDKTTGRMKAGREDGFKEQTMEISDAEIEAIEF